MPRSWVDALRAAGAVPASHLPEASLGRGDFEEIPGAELVEEPALAAHPVAPAAPPAVASFLDGIQLWQVEARVHAATLALAPATSGWLVGERAPVSTPDPRRDRLLYPLHDVETYLRSHAPRDLFPTAGSRLPKTGT